MMNDVHLQVRWHGAVVKNIDSSTRLYLGLIPTLPLTSCDHDHGHGVTMTVT